MRKKIEKKKLVDSEFVETCHEQVTNSLIYRFTVFARSRGCPEKKVDLAKYHNRHSSKSIWVIKLPFGQNGPPKGESSWQKDSLITHILFDLCLLWYLAQSTFFRDTLYYANCKLWQKQCICHGPNSIYSCSIGHI